MEEMESKSVNPENPSDDDETKQSSLTDPRVPDASSDETQTEFAAVAPEIALTVPSNRPTVPAPLSGETHELTGQRLMNRYLIGEKLGSGGFGSVYRAVDELKQSGGEDSEIAIKAMDADQIGDRLAVLVQEVSRSHRVTHPNILRVFDIHVDRGLAFITMELLEGMTLGDRISGAMLEKKTKESFLPIVEVDAIAHALCDALGHCHEQGLVHADVKPANIFITSNGVVKLLDLGISQLVGIRGKVAGFSALYASPEQIGGELADPKDDLFSVAGVLYQCLTGEHPFAGKSAKDALAAGMVADVSKLPRRYRRSIAAALVLSREGRIDSAKRLWHRINPAVRRRNAIVAALAAVALTGFLAANLIGQSTGKDAIAVSQSDRDAAEALFQSAIALDSSEAGAARADLVQAIRLNPYHEGAANLLVKYVRKAEYTNPAVFTEIWADYADAIEAAPTSEALMALAKELADALLIVDPTGMPRSRVLSEFRAPLCVLPETGYRVDELWRMRSSLTIGC